jgi:HAD superfamily hydrolase (TIGR01509 family)
MGKGKQDSTLFDDIVQVLKTKPDRILFIDDDMGNVDRAKTRGWKAIHYVDRDGFIKEIEKILPLEG